MGNSWWSSLFGLWASKNFITCRVLLKPFDHNPSETAVFMCRAVHMGRCWRERQAAEVSWSCGTAGRVCKTTTARGKTQQETTIHRTKQLWDKGHWCCSESSATSATNLFHAAVRTTYLETWSWLFAVLKPSTGTAQCSLFSGKLPSLHRNHPK